MSNVSAMTAYSLQSLISEEQYRTNIEVVKKQYNALRAIDEEFLNEKGKAAVEAFEELYYIVVKAKYFQDMVERYFEFKEDVGSNPSDSDKEVMAFMSRQFRFS